MSVSTYYLGKSHVMPVFTLALKVNILLCVSSVVLSIVWANAISFRMPSLQDILPIALLISILITGAMFYIFIRRDEMVARSLINLSLLQIFLLYSGSLSYLGATLGFPLQDATFATWDDALGLDWRGYLMWAASQPLMQEWALSVYNKPFFILPFAVMALLVFTNRGDRLEEMVSFVMVATCMTLFLGSLFPAGSAFAYYAIDPEISTRLKVIVDSTYNNYYESIRQGNFTSLTSENAKGVIAFPSFHTVVAIMLVLYVRHIWWIAVPMAMVSAGIIAVTPLIGGHYFADVLGGFVVAALSFALARWLQVRASFLSCCTV